MGEDEGRLTPAREALERGDFAEARRLAGDDPEVRAYLRPDRAVIVLAVLSFLVFVPTAVYYLVVR